MSTDFQIEHYMFIHNILGTFFKNTLNYFIHIYPRFKYKVIGTYDKTIEYLDKLRTEGREIDKPNLPAIILNPSGEFNISDRGGGRQLWRFPNLASGLGVRLYDPIYKDKNVTITPVFARLKGEIEVIVLPSSFYEYIDLRFYFLQLFGGIERPIYPFTFTAGIILPENFYAYHYYNDVTKINYILDWKNYSSQELIKSLNKNFYIFPCKITPWITLNGISDGSERYGGTEKLAEWKLSLSLEYEIEIPSFLILASNLMLEKIVFNFYVGEGGYSENKNYPPAVNIFTENIHIDHINLDSTSTLDLTVSSNVDLSEVLEISSESEEYFLKSRDVYVITELDKNSVDDIKIELDYSIEEEDKLLITCKEGKLHRGRQFDLLSSTTIVIYRSELYDNFEVGDLYEIFQYKKV